MKKTNIKLFNFALPIHVLHTSFEMRALLQVPSFNPNLIIKKVWNTTGGNR